MSSTVHFSQPALVCGYGEFVAEGTPFVFISPLANGAYSPASCFAQLNRELFVAVRDPTAGDKAAAHVVALQRAIDGTNRYWVAPTYCTGCISASAVGGVARPQDLLAVLPSHVLILDAARSRIGAFSRMQSAEESGSSAAAEAAAAAATATNAVLPLEDHVSTVAVGPDGGLIAVGYNSPNAPEAFLFDFDAAAETAAFVRDRSITLNAREWAESAARDALITGPGVDAPHILSFSPDGKMLAIVEPESVGVRILVRRPGGASAGEPAIIVNVPTHEESIRAFAWSPDSTAFLVAGMMHNANGAFASLSVYSVVTHRLLGRRRFLVYAGRAFNFSNVAFLPSAHPRQLIFMFTVNTSATYVCECDVGSGVDARDLGSVDHTGCESVQLVAVAREPGEKTLLLETELNERFRIVEVIVEPK